MVTNNHYRWDFIGLSTDDKPTPATSDKVVDGSTFYCSDNSKLYVYCKDNWYERKSLGGGGSDITVVQTTGDSTTDVMSQKAVTDALASAGGGGITELTTADYNWPENNPNGVAIWTLDSGVYVSKSGVKLYRSNNDSSPATDDSMVIVQHEGSYPTAIQYNWGGVQGSKTGGLVLGYTDNNGTLVDNTINNRIITDLSRPLVQTTGTSTISVMNQKVSSEILYGEGAPSKKIALMNSSVNERISPSSGQYNSIGDYSVLLAADWTNAAGNWNVLIGASGGALGPSSPNPNLKGCVAIGYNAVNDYNGSVSLGSFSQTSSVGEVNIGSSNTSYGYNSSNYRLLSGLYDGQNAHDAATVGQINATIDAINTALSTNIPHIGA